jgi:hypothetical protein
VVAAGCDGGPLKRRKWQLCLLVTAYSGGYVRGNSRYDGSWFCGVAINGGPATQHHLSLRLKQYSFQTRSRGAFAVTDGLWFYGVGQPASAGAAYAPRVRAPRRAARRTGFSFKSTPSDDLPSRVIRTAQRGVDPSGGSSQTMRRAEQLGPQKLLSQVTRRAATAPSVLLSGARPAFRQSK